MSWRRRIGLMMSIVVTTAAGMSELLELAFQAVMG